MAAQMAEELRILKEQLEQGLLTDEQYKMCTSKAVERYNGPGVASNGGSAVVRAPQPAFQASGQGYEAYPPPPPPAVDTFSKGGKWGKDPWSKGGKGGPPTVMGGGKGGKKGYEPAGPVMKQQPLKTYPAFDKNIDRSSQYHSESARTLLNNLSGLCQQHGGEMMLALAIGQLCKDVSQRFAYEEILGNLSPQAFAAFGEAHPAEIRIEKVQHADMYQPQWMLSLPAEAFRQE
ncbi:hypothetical protein DIPPA_35322 [Diplonema papillatum]|nr:hypothetical protein DIPPA_35322 [Diplonema papillatum]